MAQRRNVDPAHQKLAESSQWTWPLATSLASMYYLGTENALLHLLSDTALLHTTVHRSIPDQSKCSSIACSHVFQLPETRLSCSYAHRGSRSTFSAFWYGPHPRFALLQDDCSTSSGHGGLSRRRGQQENPVLQNVNATQQNLETQLRYRYFAIATPAKLNPSVSHSVSHPL